MSRFQAVGPGASSFDQSSGRESFEAARRLLAANPTCQRCGKRRATCVFSRPVDGKQCFCRDCGNLADSVAQASPRATVPTDADRRRARAASMMRQLGIG